ncbi:MAG: hypothetical protein PWP59_1675 [Sphaerochaeta sp.]|nr:hypothetical protein [Sphaerochaeta sp.]
MNNIGVEQFIADTMDEIVGIKAIIDKDPLSEIVPYLNKYSIIKVSGTLETAYKTIITDITTQGCSSIQPQNFISYSILESSKNPSYNNICSTLVHFDKNWYNSFKCQVSSLPNKNLVLDSLDKINKARNTFAHGGNPMNNINSIIHDYTHAKIIIEILDSICFGSVLDV